MRRCWLRALAALVLVSALSAQAAGVSVTTASGRPGASARIVIRGETSFSGSGQPLFVVDGVPISIDLDTQARTNSVLAPEQLDYGEAGSRMMDLDPNSIEEISVLRGAAATALYGSRAAAGAVIIKTKQGRVGPTRYTFSSRIGFDKPIIEGYITDWAAGDQGYFCNGKLPGQGGRSKRGVAAVALAVMAGGCDSFLDVNDNPNAPENARVDVTFPAVVVTFGHSVLAGSAALWGGEWMQQFSYNRDTRSYSEIHHYELSALNSDFPWTFAFADIINETENIMEETEATEDWAYHGIAKFLQAWTFSYVSDMWGPVPFNEALDRRVPDPAYDEQQVVFEGVHALLEEAIADMQRPAARRPGANDLLYGGDMTRWIKLARSVPDRLDRERVFRRAAAWPERSPPAGVGDARTARAAQYRLSRPPQRRAAGARFDALPHRSVFLGGKRHPQLDQLRGREVHRGRGPAHRERRGGRGRGLPGRHPREHAEARRGGSRDRCLHRRAAEPGHRAEPARGNHHTEVHRGLPEGRGLERLASHGLSQARDRAGRHAARHPATAAHARGGAGQQRRERGGDRHSDRPRWHDGQGVVGSQGPPN